MSMWFYDTSTGTAIRAARRGSLIEGAKALHVQGRWTWWFMWVRSLEHNTLRPRENESYIVVCAVQLWG
jgi:hypothetical protein